VQFGTFTSNQLHQSTWVSQKVPGKVSLNFVVLTILLILHTETCGPVDVTQLR
jgi:hypothetical protein